MKTEEKTIRLLLVDDETDFLEATSRALGRRGFAVNRAQDGQTALLILARQSFDVVVLDVKMPGIDGVEVFRRVSELYPGLPVVMLTGHGNIQQAFETSREGVAEYLTKPVDVDHLAEVARRLAQARKAGAAQADLPDANEAVRLLLVDDERELLDSLSPALARRGMRVIVATSGAEAIDLVERQLVDVALVDAKMPGIDGLALLRRIKKIQPLVEVIILTGHASMGLAVEALQEGAFDLLMKPQNVAALVAKIRQANRQRSERERLQQQRQVRDILERIPE